MNSCTSVGRTASSSAKSGPAGWQTGLVWHQRHSRRHQRRADRGADQLEPLADAVDFETFDVAVERGAEIVTVLLPVDEALLDEKQGEGAPGIVWGPPPSGHRIEAVVAGSPAEEAGIEGGDRLLRIDREEPQDFAQVQQVLGSDREVPVFLEIDRSGRRWGVLLP